MIIKKTYFLVILYACFLLITVPVWCQEGEPMDKTSDRFYVSYNHPRIRKGANFLGTIILQNNNPEGFLLKLVSSSGGVLSASSNSDGESDINYYITFEEATGRVGDGVNIDYNQSEMLGEHVIYQTVSQQTSTDIALKVYLNIDEDISDFLMAGKYKDQIELVYINNNAIY